MRLVAGALALAAVVMLVLAFATGGEDEPPRTAAGPPAAAAADPGLAVWTEHGCGSCHTFAAAGATGTLGPDLASNLKGMPAADVKESIVAPGAATAAGYTIGAMPEDYAARIPPEDLDALVGFLVANARR